MPAEAEHQHSPELKAGQGVAHDAQGVQSLGLGPPGYHVAHVCVNKALGHVRNRCRGHLGRIPAKALCAELDLCSDIKTVRE